MSALGLSAAEDRPPAGDPPMVLSEPAELRSRVADARSRGQRIGLVPTMGALHAGHLSLAQAARQAGDYVVVTIFVNPTQFGPHEDFQKYPRTLASDLSALGSRADLVFAPATETLYRPGHATAVVPEGVALPWEGAHRPGHFRGVATIVLKLFQLSRPDVAYFGRKDYQQCQVIRQMVRDLDLDIELVICPIVRESDGLAMSSRNVYLSPRERQQALALSRALRTGAELTRQGERSAAAVHQAMLAVLEAEPEVRLDYLAVVDPETLVEVERLDHPAVALVAARVGATRLIDNQLLEPRG